MSTILDAPASPGQSARFTNPDLTATGEPRARVPLKSLDTLWFNTGTLCNITCRNCYIESSPTNEALVYLTREEAAPFLIEAEKIGTREVGFTGGEPFMNPDILGLLEDALSQGFAVLVLTNAMAPMQRPRIKSGLVDLRRRFGPSLVVRVSLDHYSQVHHEEERGANTWIPAITGLSWLRDQGIRTALAGRMRWGESEDDVRRGYARLIAAHSWQIDASDPAQLMLFPEMEERDSVPEISTRCWSILKKSPDDMMCATSRMVVKRKGAAAPVVLPCTLLPYGANFEMGRSLAEAASADGGMFDKGSVKLCHRHCAEFCVLGGGSCS